MFQQKLIAIMGLIYASASLACASTQCPQFFLKAEVPRVGYVLCNDAYAVGYSTTLKVPLWAAEHLTDESVTRAQSLHGRGKFFVDNRLSVDNASSKMDYRASGYVRGHMVPSGDMQDWQTRNQTYLYSNIVPQDASMNSGPWNQVEQDTRQAALNDGELYVITGPILPSLSETIGPDKITVPTGLFKVVYDAMDDTSAAIMCNNDTPAQCHQISLESLQNLIGFDPVPGLSEYEKIIPLVVEGWPKVVRRSHY
ncbi:MULTISPECIES: DNA/RNA non-specific endonuclease [unclassified Saccharibacter]|uniref:DNA/RNA non-specific endonuclease n=1 Tax=unclassified Saccharibacter TaxID=2648722 RepID=UPI00132AFE6F|nr:MULTISPECIES: DNA/RNA non-specific endonuclease [unclassified Saccharibacter]MXV35814.1 DNA/RNA non-specific endonuclease [Saccharibacter sp. EH611]MXV57935.1 DNA/RNA non-specific endonuclease [Saccharibacter sp. EH70]MXV66330.1 DNA/RNA non-specific endonuclease [Saccharibacter sp. EH60]